MSENRQGGEILNNQKGFTLIELVIVIVILGILAVVATPRFIDLSTDARTAALQGVVGGINSASAVNYAAHMVDDSNGVTFTDGTTTCSAAAAALLVEGIPAGYTLENTTALTQDEGDVVACVVTQTATANTQTAQIIWTEPAPLQVGLAQRNPTFVISGT